MTALGFVRTLIFTSIGLYVVGFALFGLFVNQWGREDVFSIFFSMFYLAIGTATGIVAAFPKPSLLREFRRVAILSGKCLLVLTIISTIMFVVIVGLFSFLCEVSEEAEKRRSCSDSRSNLIVLFMCFFLLPMLFLLIAVLGMHWTGSGRQLDDAPYGSPTAVGSRVVGEPPSLWMIALLSVCASVMFVLFPYGVNWVKYAPVVNHDLKQQIDTFNRAINYFVHNESVVNLANTNITCQTWNCSFCQPFSPTKSSIGYTSPALMPFFYTEFYSDIYFPYMANPSDALDFKHNATFQCFLTDQSGETAVSLTFPLVSGNDTSPLLLEHVYFPLRFTSKGWSIDLINAPSWLQSTTQYGAFSSRTAFRIQYFPAYLSDDVRILYSHYDEYNWNGEDSERKLKGGALIALGIVSTLGLVTGLILVTRRSKVCGFGYSRI